MFFGLFDCDYILVWLKYVNIRKLNDNRVKNFNSPSYNPPPKKLIHILSKFNIECLCSSHKIIIMTKTLHVDICETHEKFQITNVITSKKLGVQLNFHVNYLKRSYNSYPTI